ncbi:MAG: ribonuclease J [Candidatus Giovannonibacteria bacterium]|nr:ribonuclease J [Candidatus Giovannonibacteria bacterium]
MPPRQEHNQRPRIRTLNDPPRLSEAGPPRIGQPSRGHSDRRAFRQSAHSAPRHNATSDRKFYKEGSLTGHEAQGHTKALKRDTVYYVPLGGLEEIGRNCSFFEYNDEIVIIDMGIQFPEEETPGVDWIIPNTSYLEKKKKNIRGLLITHGHYDHFGAIPYVLERLGNPPIYGTRLIREIIQKRLNEMPNVPKMRFIEIKSHDTVKLSEHFTAEFFGVSHTVPDTTGVALHTPAGIMVHFADFRLDYDQEDTVQNLQEFERLSKLGVHTLFLDSTNADFSGHSVSEKIVEANLEASFREAKGRIILSTFSSMITRMAEIVKIAEKIGRKVIINGRSMKDNLEIARSLGYIKYKPGTLIQVEEINKHKDDKILILSTGAQGQENSGLMRIANSEHKHIHIKPGDTVMFSSSVIPGNERGVQTLKDNFTRQGAIVITNNDLDIHSSGHAPGDDLAMVAKICKPKFIVPIHGFYFKRAANIQNMKPIGIGKERIILMDNGQVLELGKNSAVITDKTIDAFYVMVDGLGVGDVQEVVLRDRRMLSQDGIFVVIAAVDAKTGQVKGSPDIISRGFIYLKESHELLAHTRHLVKRVVEESTNKMHPINYTHVRDNVRERLGSYLFQKTNRRPMVLPVIIEV